MKRSNFLYKCLFLQIIIIFFANTATAEVLGLAGFNGSSESKYGYVGAIIPINSNLGEQGFRVRLWGSYRDYDYDGSLVGGPTGTRTTFNGDGFGGQAALGYQWNFASTKITGYAGVAYKDIDISPDDPASDTEDDDVGARLALEIKRQLNNNWDASLIGAYTIVFDTYWVRLRPGYKFDNGLKFGPEVTALGGDDFDKQKYGVFLGGMKLGNLGITLSTGAERDSGDTDWYGGFLDENIIESLQDLIS